MPFKSAAIQDVYDEGLISSWNNMTIFRKEQLMFHYFQDIKSDCLKNYGMVNADNMQANIRESAYRILRFGFINDPERFILSNL